MSNSINALRSLMLPVTAAVALAAVPAAAQAASTTVTPAGHAITVASSTIKFLTPGTGYLTCTVAGGSATIPAAPANHNGSGAVEVTMTTRPAFSGCTESPALGGPPAPPVTSGTWKIAFQGGAASTAALKIPTNGLRVWGEPAATCFADNISPASFGGAWQNGTASPLADSSFPLFGSTTIAWQASGCLVGNLGQQPLVMDPSFGAANKLNVRNTTNPASPIQVGL